MFAALCIRFFSIARRSQHFYARDLTFPQKRRHAQIEGAGERQPSLRKFYNIFSASFPVPVSEAGGCTDTFSVSCASFSLAGNIPNLFINRDLSAQFNRINLLYGK